MKIPFYNPPNEVQKICGLEHIGVDDVFKIIFDMPVGEEEAFQIVETLTDTDTAVDFFSKNEVKASNAREKIFRRVDRTFIKRGNDPPLQMSFSVLRELYRMNNAGVPVHAGELYKASYEFSEKAKESLQNLMTKAAELGISVTEKEIRGRTYSFPDEYPDLDTMLEEVRKDIKHANMLNTKKLQKYIFKDSNGWDRLITHWDIYGAASGRIQSSDYNSQGLPKEVRKCCIVPQKGYSHVCADYVSEELVLIAVLTGDQRLLDDVLDGFDLHKAIAGELFSKDIDAVTAEERKLVKSVDFPYLYGAGDCTLTTIIEEFGFDITVSQVKQAINAILANVKPTIAKIHRQGYVELINGTQIMLKDIPKKHTAFNRMIQGSGAVILKEVIADVARMLPEPAKICFLLHDELMVETPSEYEEVVINVVTGVMTGILRRHGYEVDMPIDIIVKKGGE